MDFENNGYCGILSLVPKESLSVSLKANSQKHNFLKFKLVWLESLDHC